jgi:hypothetical protein
VREGLREIIQTLLLAIGLVAIVVLSFAELAIDADSAGRRTCLARGHLRAFPFIGFSINTLSLWDRAGIGWSLTMQS